MSRTVAVVSLGGVLGALARYGLGVAFPSLWTTFWINVVGCLLIGVLMVLVTERHEVHPLVRPFLGVGVLGGFTTFSGYVLDVQRAVAAGEAGTALVYLVGTMLAALAAVLVGVRLTRLLAGVRR